MDEYNLGVLFDREASDPKRQAVGRFQASDACSPDPIRGELERVLASRTLAPSQQLCRLLQFVVDQEASGRGDQLKEYLVGVEVFRKGESFDPRTDPVVRTEARR